MKSMSLDPLHELYCSSNGMFFSCLTEIMFDTELPGVTCPRRFKFFPQVRLSLRRGIGEISCSVHLGVLGMLRPKGVFTRELQQPS